MPIHRPEPAAGGSLPRRRSGSGYLSGSLNACDSVVGAAISRPELAAFGGSPPGSRSGKRAVISRPYDVAGSWCVRQRPSGIAAMRARDARDPRRESGARQQKRRPIPLPIPRSIFSSHKTPRRLPGLGRRRSVYCPFIGRSNTGRCPHSGRPSCGSPRGWRLAARHAFAQCHYRTIRCRHIPVFPQVGQVNRRFVKVW